MEKFKGTKGVFESIVLDCKDFRQICIASNQRKTVIAHMYLGDSKSIEEDKANAQLFATAPDMLNLLQSLENDNNHIPKVLWDEIQNTINKALSE